MKKIFGIKDKESKEPSSPPTGPKTTTTTTSYTSGGTTTGMEKTGTETSSFESEPTVVYEKKVVEEQPIRHESVRGGIKETFKHPIDAFKGQPRDRSPTAVRRREYTEREVIPREERKVYKTVQRPFSETLEGSTQKPKSAKELRSEFRRETYVTKEHPEREATETTEDPLVHVETRERGPVVKEHIQPKEIEEIQPVIHREREKTEIIEVTKPIIEREVLPTTISEKTLPAETRPTIFHEESEQFKQRYKHATEKYKASVEVAPTEREVIEKPPIVKEHVVRKVIEEIQPVIYREITEPHITREVKPIYEKVVDEPTLVEKGDTLQESKGYRQREYRETEIPREHKEKHKEKEYKEAREPYYTKSREPEIYEQHGEPEYREYYNEKGELIREYHYREGEYSKPMFRKKEPFKRTEVERDVPSSTTKVTETRG